MLLHRHPLPSVCLYEKMMTMPAMPGTGTFADIDCNEYVHLYPRVKSTRWCSVELRAGVDNDNDVKHWKLDDLQHWKLEDLDCCNRASYT